MPARGSVGLRDEQSLSREALAIVERMSYGIHAQLGGRMPLDELRSIGNAAVIELVRAHDESVAPFEPYMVQRLRWAMLDGARREARAATRARALLASEALGSAPAAKPLRQVPPTEQEYRHALSNMLGDHATAMSAALIAGEPTADSSSAPDKSISHATRDRALRNAIAALGNADHRLILERHYFDGARLEDIGRELGHSKSWASRHHARAIRTLSNLLRGGELDPKQ